MKDKRSGSAQKFARPFQPPVRTHRKGVDRLATGLGWFSLGLGVSQLVAPDRLARLLGTRPDPRFRLLMAGLGARDIATGIGILSSKQRAPWLWGRVLGDVMDLCLLATLPVRRKDVQRGSLAPAIGFVAGTLVLDGLAARRVARKMLEERAVITIHQPPGVVYRFWRNFGNLPKFMEHVESIDVVDERRSHWTVLGPAGARVEWDAELVHDEPNVGLVWRTLRDADVSNAGTVHFRPAPGNRGTEVHVRLRWEAPGGRVGKAVAKLFGRAPGQQIRSDLRRLKQVIEAGQVVHSEASLRRGPHPGQPRADGRTRWSREEREMS